MGIRRPGSLSGNVLVYVYSCPFGLSPQGGINCACVCVPDLTTRRPILHGDDFPIWGAVVVSLLAAGAHTRICRRRDCGLAKKKKGWLSRTPLFGAPIGRDGLRPMGLRDWMIDLDRVDGFGRLPPGHHRPTAAVACWAHGSEVSRAWLRTEIALANLFSMGKIRVTLRSRCAIGAG